MADDTTFNFWNGINPFLTMHPSGDRHRNSGVWWTEPVGMAYTYWAHFCVSIHNFCSSVEERLRKLLKIATRLLRNESSNNCKQAVQREVQVRSISTGYLAEIRTRGGLLAIQIRYLTWKSIALMHYFLSWRNTGKPVRLQRYAPIWCGKKCIIQSSIKIKIIK